MNLNSYALPLSYRNPLYNHYTPPYLGYGGLGYNEAYLNGLRNINKTYLNPYNLYELDLAKRYNATRNKYSYYQPDLYKTSYNYTNPYPLLGPVPALNSELPKNTNKTYLPSIQGATKNKPAKQNEKKKSYSDNDDYLDYSNIKTFRNKLEPLAKKSENFSNNYNKKFSEDQPIRGNNSYNNDFLAQYENSRTNNDDLTPLNTNLDLNMINSSDQPDFIMNNNGRLTETKSMKTSNNIHDYLYSLSKKESEGYVEKYKDEQHRKTAYARKKKYGLQDYKKFIEDDPTRARETTEQKFDKVKKRNTYADYVRDRNARISNAKNIYDPENGQKVISSLPNLQPSEKFDNLRTANLRKTKSRFSQN